MTAPDPDRPPLPQGPATPPPGIPQPDPYAPAPPAGSFTPPGGPAPSPTAPQPSYAAPAPPSYGPPPTPGTPPGPYGSAPGAPRPPYGAAPGSPYATGAPGTGGVPPRPPSTNVGWVVAAFILCWPLAIPALLASQRASGALRAGRLDETRHEAGRARSWGIAAVVTGSVLAVGWIVALVVAVSAGMFAATTTSGPSDLADPSGTVTEEPGDDLASEPTTEETTEPEATQPEEPAAAAAPVDKHVAELAVGDCFDGDALGENVFTVPVTTCEGEHRSEVYAVTTLADGQFPGDEQIHVMADEYCTQEFERFVGLTYDDSELYLWWFPPGKQNWVAGDRTVQCIIEPYEGTVSGTLAGAAR